MATEPFPLRNQRPPVDGGRPDGSGPAREWLWARMLRWRSDRAQLLDMDVRLLADAGLTREDVLRGTPFASEQRVTRPDGGSTGLTALGRVGTLEARGWALKLYAVAGRRAEEPLAARVFRAALADIRSEPQLGFAVLRQPRAEEALLPGDRLALIAWWWTGELLTRAGFLASSSGKPPCRLPGCSMDDTELELLAGESSAWRRHVLGRGRPDTDAYLSEDCA